MCHSMASFQACTHSWRSSRWLKRMARAPPGRRTRLISARASSNRNQWNAWATVTTSTLPSGSGMASAVPSSASTSGLVATSCSRMPGTGSTATTSAPVAARRRVSLPVPAARSQTRVPGPTPSSRRSSSTASAGYDGRAAS